ncbi:DUF5825 family protein [Nitrospirillum sp. BR 11163]|uniref:DUF5825 family protein n=1 Tax=Nitrospirillum sp. BR 11163 TaxID=3104323 RepID=UPI002AFFB8CA|nr:DUF5825 family protein [Nitrospirillum sp. BR 11163]MEA1671953.1 DUF5825 family protein [Nitrospirillum sp. BR 11163]
MLAPVDGFFPDDGAPSLSARELHLRLLDDPPPSLREIEAFCQSGLSFAKLTGPSLPEPADAAESQRTLRWIECLRDFTACGVVVDWPAAAELAGRVAQLCHIVPPRKEAGAFDRWHVLHRFGTCYSRFGPNFILIKDRRDPENGAEFLLEGTAHESAFRKCQSVAPLDGFDAAEQDALTELVEEKLVLVLHGSALALPFRMRHWPVPFTAI